MNAVSAHVSKPVFSGAQQLYIANAIAKLDEKIAHDKYNLSANYNKALLQLSIGDFKNGWELFEWRLNIPNCKYAYAHFPVKRWKGEDIGGKHLFIWFEQGMGDHIMCASMLQDIVDKVGPDGTVTVLTMRRLTDIFARSFPGVTFYKVGEPVPDRLRDWKFDYQLSMSDMGQLTRPSFDAFKHDPFLKADPAKVAHFKAKYQAMKNHPDDKLIGVGWRSLNPEYGDHKSVPVEIFMPRWMPSGVTFVNLQYGNTLDEISWARAHGVQIIDDMDVDQLVDTDTFAAQVAAMDRVISTSNSGVHLAGALGVETTVMVPLGKGRCWYWFSEMKQSPWYRSVTVLRPSGVDDWAPVINNVWADLSAANMPPLEFLPPLVPHNIEVAA